MMQKNENRPGYKKTTLGQVANIYSGGTPSRAKPDFWGGKIPWVKTTQIKNSIILESDIGEWITEEGLKKSSAKMIPEGTILMAMYGQGKTRGRVAVLGLNATINQACAAISLKSTANRAFVFQQLLSKYTAIRKMSNSGGQDNLSSGLIKEIPIHLPSLPEQEGIAGVLECWDRGIRTLEKKIEKKRLIKKGLMQRLLSGQLRLPGFSEDWKTVKLRKVLKFKTGFPFESNFFNEDGKGVRLVKNRDLKNDNKTYFYSGKYSPEFVVDNGDVLIGMDGDFSPCLWNKGAALLNQRVGRIHASKNANLLFLYHFLHHPLKKLERITASTTVKHLSHGNVESLMEKIPALEEQQAIAEVLSAADGEIEVLERKLAKWRDQKKYLLNNLVTGTIRLPEFRTPNSH